MAGEADIRSETSAPDATRTPCGALLLASGEPEKGVADLPHPLGPDAAGHGRMSARTCPASMAGSRRPRSRGRPGIGAGASWSPRSGAAPWISRIARPGRALVPGAQILPMPQIGTYPAW